MVRFVFRPFHEAQRTICPSVSLRASTRVSPDFVPFSAASGADAKKHRHTHHTHRIRQTDRQADTDTDTDKETDKETQTQTHAETHTKKAKINFLLSEMVLPQPLRDSATHVRSRGGTQTSTLSPPPLLPFVSLFLFLFTMFSFDILSSHGSGSAQKLSVTASESNCENPRICFCNRKLTRQIIFLSAMMSVSMVH